MVSAIFLFRPTQEENDILRELLFYAPNNGDIAGAANAFKEMFKNQNIENGLPDRFYRANSSVKLAQLENYTDYKPEYGYFIFNDELQAFQFDYTKDPKNPAFNLEYLGLLADFVNKHVAADDKCLPIINNKSRSSLFKEFHERVNASLSLTPTNAVKAYKELQAAKQLATLIELSKFIIKELEIIESWYKDGILVHDLTKNTLVDIGYRINELCRMDQEAIGLEYKWLMLSKVQYQRLVDL